MKTRNRPTATFACPECYTPVPKSKVFSLNKSSEIECRQCSTILKPKESTLKKNTLIAAGVVGGLTASTLQYFGLIGGAIGLIVSIFVVIIITMNIVEFEIIEAE